MNDIKVLDCTLRDGGYVNDWRFGQRHIHSVRQKLETAGADIIELGFMRDEPYDPDRAVYDSIDPLLPIIGQKKEGTIYSALIEMANFFPPDRLAPRRADGPDLMRYSFWMRCLDEAYEYCQGIVDKGYLLGVQPTRVEQYSDEQFAAMCRRFSQLQPFAIYIVDTFGLLTKEQLIRYARIADENVGEGIRVGYHAHNNMQQAFSNATTFIELGLEHDIVLDASVYGMGRGAGNLNLELIGSFINAKQPGRFDISAMTDIWDETLRDIHERLPWGYSLEYFLVAAAQCNPNYASFFLQEHPDMKVSHLCRVLEGIRGSDKYLYSAALAERLYDEVVR